MQFEQLLSDARKESYVKNFGAEWGRDNFEREQRDFAWHLVRDFFEPYQAAGVYPIERLPGATYWLMDLKLEEHLLTNSLIPIHNTIVFGKEGFSLSNPRTHPETYLDHICITKAMIGQVRIVWERLMCLVYYLETGTNATRRGSVQRAFFGQIDSWGNRWGPLKEWESEIRYYDENFRTPEFHNNSKLRAGIFKDKLPDPNSIITLLDPVKNGFWRLLVANVKGRQSGILRLGRSQETELRMEAHRLKDSGE
jgi:hypothetical protein